MLDFLFLTVVVAGSIGSVDFLWQRAEHIRKNRMTDREIQDEFKEAEGDPHLKQERRRRGQEAATGQMLSDVAKADVVIVNPTHYSVALRYDKGKESAPRVVAKGTDAVAAKIREVARHSGVPIVERPPLARLMHKLVPEGDVIPEDLYNAVAEVLAYVYRLRNREA